MINLPITLRTSGRNDVSGFTLLELALVVIIIGMFSAMTVGLGLGKIDEAKEIQTALKLDKLEEALAVYREKNLRLPCPGAQSDVAGNANYGLEAANPGRCTGSSPAATYTDATRQVAEGAVPFRTLGLTEEFAYDGWGRRINYAVGLRYTETEAFEVYDIHDRCDAAEQGATIEANTDPLGANVPRSKEVAYALISFGANGHGAFTRNGARFNANSVNADELENCNCDGSGVYNGAYAATYVMRTAQGLAGDTSGFDDYVRYRLRWQLQTIADRRVLSYAGPEVMFGTSVAPYVRFYAKSCDTYTPMASPASVPGAAPNAVAVSSDNNYWAAAGPFSPLVYIYNRNTTTGAITKLTDPASLPAGVNGNGVAFSMNKDGNYMALAHDLNTGVSLSIFKITQSPTPHTFTLLTPTNGPDVQPPANAHAVLFHPDGYHLLVTHDAAPYISLYARLGDVFTNNTVVFDVAPSARPTAAAFSPDGRYLVTGYSASPYLKIYNLDFDMPSLGTTTFTLLASTPTLSAAVNSLSFDRKSRVLAVGQTNTSQSLNLYAIDRTSATPFTLIPVSGGGPSSNASVSATAFSPRQHVLLTGEDSAGSSAGVMKYIVGNSQSQNFPRPPAPFPSSQPAGVVKAIAVRHPLRSN